MYWKNNSGVPPIWKLCLSIPVSHKLDFIMFYGINIDKFSEIIEKQGKKSVFDMIMNKTVTFKHTEVKNRDSPCLARYWEFMKCYISLF